MHCGPSRKTSISRASMRSPFSVLTIRLSSWIACERPQRHLSEHLHEPVPRLLFGAHLYFCPKFAFRVENLEVRQGGGQRLGRSSSLHPRVLKKFRCVQPPRSARDPTTARPGNGREPAVGLADAVRFSNLFTSAVASELTCFHCLSGKSTCVCTPRVSESRAEKSPQAHLGVLHSAQNLRCIFAPKRSIAAQQNVHDDPQAPDVARFVVTFPKAGDHLRCCAQQSHTSSRREHVECRQASAQA